ncbi:MAG: hypothetical protein AB7L09_21980 [Nitrospira sp.]
MMPTYTRASGIHLYSADTATDLHEDMCDRLAYGESKTMDLITSVDVQQHNVVGVAESFEWMFDLRDLWLTKSRWTTMVRQYINPIALETWLNTIEKKLKGRKRGVSIMRTNEVQQQSGPTRDGSRTRVWRAWGSCMLAIGYRALPRPQITLHSRTSYLGYIGALDMSVAYVCAKQIAERVGIEVEDIQFVWHLECAQFHAFKSLAYLLAEEGAREDFLALRVGEDTAMDQVTKRRTPSLYIARKWMNQFEQNDKDGVTYGDMNFGQTRRIRKRYHTEVLGYQYGAPYEGGDHRSASQNRRFKPLPSCRVDDLDFSCLFNSTGRRSNRVSWDESNVAKVDTTNEKDDDALAE